MPGPEMSPSTKVRSVRAKARTPAHFVPLEVAIALDEDVICEGVVALHKDSGHLSVSMVCNDPQQVN
jgi:hypothetical protein